MSRCVITKVYCFIYLLSLCFSSFSLADSTGEVQFLALGHPSAIRIVGKETGVQSQFVFKGGSLSGTAKVVLDGFTTGINKRDEHMKKKYLETDKFPDATFSLNPLPLAAVFQTADAKIDGVPFTGKLKLHGVEKDISGTADIKKNKKLFSVVSKFSFKVQDYQIAVPSFAGITVADQIDVDVKLETSPE